MDNNIDQKYLDETVRHLINNYGHTAMLESIVGNLESRNEWAAQQAKNGFDLSWCVEINNKYIEILTEAIKKTVEPWEE